MTGPATVADALQPGSSLVCACYTMFGSSTELVLTFGDGVHVFSLDPTIGEFLLTRRNLVIPPGGGQKIYSVNEGNFSAFPKGVQKVGSCGEGADFSALCLCQPPAAGCHESR